MSDSESDSALLHESVQLFNAGQYYAAHEALEQLWEAGYGESADFYKGLLQASIALHHFQLGNLDGTRKLYTGHRRYLAPYLPKHLGVDVAALLENMQAYLRPVIRAIGDERPTFDHEGRPQIAYLGRS